MTEGTAWSDAVEVYLDSAKTFKIAQRGDFATPIIVRNIGPNSLTINANGGAVIVPNTPESHPTGAYVLCIGDAEISTSGSGLAHFSVTFGAPFEVRIACK